MSSTGPQLPTDLLPGKDTTSILTAHADALNRDFVNQRSYVENMSFHDDSRNAESIILKEMKDQLDALYELIRLSNSCTNFNNLLRSYRTRYNL